MQFKMDTIIYKIYKFDQEMTQLANDLRDDPLNPTKTKSKAQKLICLN